MEQLQMSEPMTAEQWIAKLRSKVNEIVVAVNEITSWGLKFNDKIEENTKAFEWMRSKLEDGNKLIVISELNINGINNALAENKRLTKENEELKEKIERIRKELANGC